jgi:hypothetical protein
MRSDDPEQRLLSRARLAQAFRGIIDSITLHDDRTITVQTKKPHGGWLSGLLIDHNGKCLRMHESVVSSTAFDPVFRLHGPLVAPGFPE